MNSNENEKLRIMNSSLAVQIMSQIGSEGNRDYGSNIAEELDKTQTSICRILTALKKVGFVEKEEERRIHYYSVDYDSIANYWHQRLVENLRSIDNCEKWIEDLEEHRKQARDTLSEFLKETLEGNKDLQGHNLNHLIFDNFVCSILHILKEDEEFFRDKPGIHKAVLATAFERHEKGYPEAMKKAIDRTV